MSTTSPARNSIDHHCAGTTHADPTGESIGKLGVLFTLNPGHHIEYGLAWLPGYLVDYMPTARGIATPYAYFKTIRWFLQL
jgi:hypothetical protein